MFVMNIYSFFSRTIQW